MTHESSRLPRRLGLWALTATGVCSMVGAAINVLPLMIQRNVPGIGPYVLPAYVAAAVPAALAALCYAVLASAMPRAGGSYIYASRSLNPFLGFIASFSQWFGLSVAIGVVSYLLIPFLRDIASALGWAGLAGFLDHPELRTLTALGFLWFFVWVNIRGIEAYRRIVLPLMIIMFLCGAVVIPAGFSYDHGDFAAALLAKEGVALPVPPPVDFNWSTFLAASAVLFSTFIGFDSIAQAGGEAIRPRRNLPLAIGIALLGVGGYYLLFSSAVYHAVPWHFVAERAATQDLTAPGVLGYLLAPGWTIAITAGAAIALINDLPAMLLAVSRLLFAWADDGLFPAWISDLHPQNRTPHRAIVLSALMASAAILGCYAAGDFFLGVDVLIISMLVNFLLICLSVLILPLRNPHLDKRITVVSNATIRRTLAAGGVLALGLLTVFQVRKDLSADMPAWYFRSTWLWVMVCSIAGLLFWRGWRRMRREGVDLERRFSTLPPE